MVVFIHGIIGHCERTWGNLPQFILREACVECDVFSYQYPAGIGQDAGMKMAAASLGPALDKYRKDYKHFVFIVHSTGGLILKYLLSDDFCRITGGESASDWANPDVDSYLITRVRAIVNITVPHYGSTRLLSNTLIPFAHCISKVCERPLKLLQFVLHRSPALGHNNIAWELRWGNSELRDLEEKRLGPCLDSLNRWDLIFPTSDEIRARDDQAVPGDSDFDKSKAFARYPKPRSDHISLLCGNHFSVKLPFSADEPIVNKIAESLKRFSEQRMAMAVAHSTVARATRFDRAFSVIWDTVPHDADSPRRFQECIAGSQYSIYVRLCDIVERERVGVQRIIVTGDGLVGKSTVLRRLARRLAAQYLASRTLDKPLPIYFLMKQVELEQIDWSGRGGSHLLDSLLAHWVQWARDITGDASVTLKAVEEHMQDPGCVIILDGVDEFLGRNTWITIEDFTEMVRYVGQHYHENKRLTFIFALRSTQRRLHTLFGAGDESLEVTPVTERQMRRIPRLELMQRLIDATPNTSVRELLKKPIATTWLAPSAESLLSRGGLHTRADVYLEIMRSIIDSRKLTEREYPNVDGDDEREIAINTFSEAEYWIDAVAIVGAEFFRGFATFLSVESTKERLIEQRDAWLHWCRAISASTNGLQAHIEKCFELISNRAAFVDLLELTVFFDYGREQFRVSHEEIEEFLAARFLYLCIRLSFFDQLRHRAFTQAMFKTASEMLGDAEFSPTNIQLAVQNWHDTKHPLIIANFCALLGNARPKLDGEALDLITNSLPTFPLIAQLVTFTSLGQWVLSSSDPSDEYIRLRVARLCSDYLGVNAKEVTDPVLRSLAWNLQKAIFWKHKIGSNPKGDESLGKDNDDVCAALNLMGSQSPLSDLHRSLQHSFSDVQRVVLHDPDRPVSTVHYLYYISCAAYQGYPIREVTSELGEIFSRGSEIGMKIRGVYASYRKHHPEIFQLFQTCESLWKQAGNR